MTTSPMSYNLRRKINRKANAHTLFCQNDSLSHSLVNSDLTSSSRLALRPLTKCNNQVNTTVTTDGRKEMFYLTMHSRHFYLRLCDVGHLIKYHCICTYACMYVCMYVFMYACTYVRVCMHVHMYVCICVCMYVCMYMCKLAYVINTNKH